MSTPPTSRSSPYASPAGSRQASPARRGTERARHSWEQQVRYLSKDESAAGKAALAALSRMIPQYVPNDSPIRNALRLVVDNNDQEARTRLYTLVDDFIKNKAPIH